MVKNDTKVDADVVVAPIPVVVAPIPMTLEAIAALESFRAAAVCLVADDSQITTNMIQRMLNANTVDTILDSEPEEETEGDSNVTHLADIIGNVFTINSVELRASELEDSKLGCYAVMHTDEYGVVTSGATQVVVALVALKDRERRLNEVHYPVVVKAYERKTKKGNTVRWLQRPSTKSIEQQKFQLERLTAPF